MPQIIPIRDLKNTSEISQKCHASNEPVFITKNGYGDMVIMSMKTYEEQMFMLDVYKKLAEADRAVCMAQARLEYEREMSAIKTKFGMTR